MKIYKTEIMNELLTFNFIGSLHNFNMQELAKLSNFSAKDVGDYSSIGINYGIFRRIN